MRNDILMIILAVILIAAMALTIIYGKERSRHGYGSTGRLAIQSYS